MRYHSKPLCVILSLMLVLTCLSSCYAEEDGHPDDTDALAEHNGSTESDTSAESNGSTEGDESEAVKEGAQSEPLPKKDGKVLLVSIDGLRADAISASPYADSLKQSSTYCTNVTTVYPSITLPCHMSMHHGVGPESHGVLTNTYTASAEPTAGIAETLSAAGKSSAAFYNWGPIGDVISDGALVKEEFIDGETLGWKATNEALAASCKDYLMTNEVDFTFLYLGCLDEQGHVHGWLSEEYTRELDASLALVFDIMSILPEEYTVIITSDHGGHGVTHGSNSPEDMIIPIFLIGDSFAAGKEIAGASILDVAPTVVHLFGVAPQKAWEGTVLK